MARTDIKYGLFVYYNEKQSTFKKMFDTEDEAKDFISKHNIQVKHEIKMITRTYN